MHTKHHPEALEYNCERSKLFVEKPSRSHRASHSNQQDDKDALGFDMRPMQSGKNAASPDILPAQSIQKMKLIGNHFGLHAVSIACRIPLEIQELTFI